MKSSVSIIIPFRDKAELLKICVDSIIEKTLNNFEIILVDNSSKKKETSMLLVDLCLNHRIKTLHYPNESFNFSAINNFAAKRANGEYILFLNNDTEVISGRWIEKMLECFNDEKVGAVGAKLLYPDNTIQHMGVILEENRLATHAFRGRNESDVIFDEPREWSAVTAACMMTKKSLFLEMNGFNEDNLAIAYNDVDYCLRLRKAGYKIICTPHAKLYHYESATRKADVKIIYKYLSPLKFLTFKKIKRYRQFIQEQKYMKKCWKNEIKKDPFYEKIYT